MERIVAEHTELAEVIAGRDPEALAARLRAHMAAVHAPRAGRFAS